MGSKFSSKEFGIKLTYSSNLVRRVTRFGEFLSVYLEFANKLNLLYYIFNTMRQIFPVMNGQKLQKVILPSGHTARSRPVQ